MGTVTGAPLSSTRGVGTGSTTKGISPAVWADALIATINKIGGTSIPETANNIQNITRMITGETAGQQGGFLRDNNPLNLNTWGSSHSSLPGGQIVTMPGQGGKTVWVQQFDSVEQGLTETANTILAPNNSAMLKALENNSPTAVFGGALSTSSWKSGGYASSSGISKYAPATGTSAVGGVGNTFSVSKGLKAVEHAGSDVAKPVAAAYDATVSVGKFLGDLTNPQNLKNVGIFVAGLALVGVGTIILISTTKTAHAVEGAAVRAV